MNKKTLQLRNDNAVLNIEIIDDEAVKYTVANGDGIEICDITHTPEDLAELKSGLLKHTALSEEMVNSIVELIDFANEAGLGLTGKYTRVAETDGLIPVALVKRGTVGETAYNQCYPNIPLIDFADEGDIVLLLSDIHCNYSCAIVTDEGIDKICSELTMYGDDLKKAYEFIRDSSSGFITVNSNTKSLLNCKECKEWRRDKLEDAANAFLDMVNTGARACKSGVNTLKREALKRQLGVDDAGLDEIIASLKDKE